MVWELGEHFLIRALGSVHWYFGRNGERIQKESEPSDLETVYESEMEVFRGTNMGSYGDRWLRCSQCGRHSKCQIPRVCGDNVPSLIDIDGKEPYLSSDLCYRIPI